MQASDWANCKLLKPAMNWGEPDKMEKWFVLELDAFLVFLTKPFLISCGTNKGHVNNSQHYLGKAADVQFPGAHKRDLVDIYIAASRFKFKGIGVYPEWHTPGLHLDWREAPYAALWLGYEGGGKQVYEALDLQNLTTHVMLD